MARYEARADREADWLLVCLFSCYCRWFCGGFLGGADWRFVFLPERGESLCVECFEAGIHTEDRSVLRFHGWLCS